ncbi:hypothetical protein SLEP1_g18409 [Rubroshorea leprosula]|uniref:Uncharacterized protein n=1 Tax=Rubroshorea leprosula TaxID=152421 RepID=A0AAV5J6A6_9ROSI|nr:hypothetical protein SLEP1_g18409 [Rubroshorea leprosula]
MVLECEFDKFRALCIYGIRLTSAQRLSRLEFGFWDMTIRIATTKTLNLAMCDQINLDMDSKDQDTKHGYGCI